jgi:hypothetical protein
MTEASALPTKRKGAPTLGDSALVKNKKSKNLRVDATSLPNGQSPGIGTGGVESHKPAAALCFGLGPHRTSLNKQLGLHTHTYHLRTRRNATRPPMAAPAKRTGSWLGAAGPL